MKRNGKENAVPAAPVPRAMVLFQAVADLAQVTTLANNLRTGLIDLGLFT